MIAEVTVKAPNITPKNKKNTGAVILEPIRNSLQFPKGGRSVLAENQRISMLKFSAINKGGGLVGSTCVLQNSGVSGKHPRLQKN